MSEDRLTDSEGNTILDCLDEFVACDGSDPIDVMAMAAEPMAITVKVLAIIEKSFGAVLCMYNQHTERFEKLDNPPDVAGAITAGLLRHKGITEGEFEKSAQETLERLKKYINERTNLEG